MGCAFTCSRNALISLNIMYMLVAILLIAVAAYAKATSFITNLAMFGALIGCGVFLCLLGFVGCFGAMKHHQICLFFYMVILFLLFLVQFSVAVALLAVNSQTQKDLAVAGWSHSQLEWKTNFQENGNCCGLLKWNETDPSCAALECCKAHEPETVKYGCCSTNINGSNINCPRECMPCINLVDSGFKIAGGVGLFISLTEMFGVITTIRYRNQRSFRSDSDFL